MAESAFPFASPDALSAAPEASLAPAESAPASESGALLSWRQALKQATRDPIELGARLALPAALVAQAVEAAKLFPLVAPERWLQRIAPGDLTDPLLRQILPLAAEGAAVAGFLPDPVGDDAAKRAPGMLQKYEGRALLVATGACAIHCRYCFRRHYPYDESPRGLAAWEPTLAEIEADDSLHEVLISGGDPLTLVDATFAALVRRLDAIPHLKRLRIHTRLLIVIPERVTRELVELLGSLRATPVVVVHANHAKELDDEVGAALAELRRAGAMLLNQAVLLRGVNDDVETLAALSERLLELRVVPYYLNQLDRVQGAAHFEVLAAEGLALIEALRRRLPGYAVPRYVQEIAGEPYKTPLV
ncbi:MAG TPA: EF-P beta-lysylation protein EpmB [Pirellulales bacterium]